MKFGSVCSGIDAASVAWNSLGWEAKWFSEIEAFPSAVLKYRYPDVPNYGDMTKFREWPEDARDIDVLVGGTPCQSFSVAGLRAGLADPRGNLMLTYLAIAAECRPKWIVWENVPGVLSSVSHSAPDPCPPPDPMDMELDGQEVGTEDEYEAIESDALGCFLGGLAELGYGFAYRVLDAQFTRSDGYRRAVPQRRRRVFVVGYLGDWRRAAAVLFDGASLRGDPAPRREAGKAVAADVVPSLTASGRGVERTGETRGQDPVIAVPPVSVTRSERDRKGPLPEADLSTVVVSHALRADGFDASEDGTGRGTPIVPVVAASLTRGAESSGKGGYAGRRQEDDSNIIASVTGDQNASPQEGNTRALLSALREAIGEEAFAQWGLGVSHSLQSQKVLRSEVHGGGVRREADEAGCGVDDGALSCSSDGSSWSMREMWKAGRERCAPQGRELPEQLSRELGQAMSGLSFEGASVWAFVQALRQAGEGLGVLQSSLSTVQRRSSWAVRRLTPEECESLQGFPRGYTSIPYRNKPAADGPRYKALGNSMAVNVMRAIGQRIAMVDKL